MDLNESERILVMLLEDPAITDINMLRIPINMPSNEDGMNGFLIYKCLHTRTELCSVNRDNAHRFLFKIALVDSVIYIGLNHAFSHLGGFDIQNPKSDLVEIKRRIVESTKFLLKSDHFHTFLLQSDIALSGKICETIKNILETGRE